MGYTETMWTILTNPTSLLIALGWIAFLLYWIISAPGKNLRLRVMNSALTLALSVAVAGLFFLMGTGNIPESVNPALWQDSLPVGLCADFLVLVSLFILIWSRRTLGSNWSAQVRNERATELVTSGPYAFVRHPIYTGFIGLVLGTAIAYGRFAGILIWVVFTVGLYVKSQKEESVLMNKFKDEYATYRAKTKALFPFLL